MVVYPSNERPEASPHVELDWLSLASALEMPTDCLMTPNIPQREEKVYYNDPVFTFEDDMLFGCTI